jgi:hypothetical protein
MPQVSRLLLQSIRVLRHTFQTSWLKAGIFVNDKKNVNLLAKVEGVFDVTYHFHGAQAETSYL